MLLRRYPLLLLTTTLIMAATEGASTAFTVTPRQPGASIRYRYSENYSKKRGITQINSYLPFDPRSILFGGQVREITRGGTSGLMNVLQPFVDRGWTFNQAENDLSGRFDVEYYYACGIPTNCGQEKNRGRKGGVGSFLSLKYYPNGADPQPGQGKLHWIQRVVSNHKAATDVHGESEDIIDVRPGYIQDPYYDSTSEFAGEDFFMDRPFRPDPENNHNWFAALYLVEETAPQTATIYNGVRWGWRNTYTNPVDLALVFDTSDSMTDEIVPVSSFALDIVNELFAEFPDTKVAITNYRDFPGFSIKNPFFCSNLSFVCSPQGSGAGDRPYQAILPFTDIRSSLTNVLSNSFLTRGGGDWPETSYSALINTLQAKDLRGWREDAKKVIIHFTDAAPHDPEPNTGYTAQSVIRLLAEVGKR